MTSILACSSPIDDVDERAALLLVLSQTRRSASGPKSYIEKAARPGRDGPPAE